MVGLRLGTWLPNRSRRVPLRRAVASGLAWEPGQILRRIFRAPLFRVEDEEQFIAKAAPGFEFEACRVSEAFDAFAVGEGGSVAPAENHGADGEVEFIDDAGAKKGFIEGAAAFAEQAFDLPFFAQPA